MGKYNIAYIKIQNGFIFAFQPPFNVNSNVLKVIIILWLSNQIMFFKKDAMQLWIRKIHWTFYKQIKLVWKFSTKWPCKNQSNCTDGDLKLMIFHIQHHQNVKGIIYLFSFTMLSSKNVFENRIHQLISTILVT